MTTEACICCGEAFDDACPICRGLAPGTTAAAFADVNAAARQVRQAVTGPVRRQLLAIVERLSEVLARPGGTRP